MDVGELAKAIQAGTRRALAKGITLVESQKRTHLEAAQKLLAQIDTQGFDTLRVGISGPPGVGKSTFIEALGLHLLAAGKKVAVLAVDPTSPISGGSILGDKTRMERLGQAENAYVRPSSSGGYLGGVARQTREAMLLCEAAGYDIVLVETVGVGQSEIEVAQMVDFFLLLLQPGGGDELQGVKKGILEMADLLLVNKADGDLVNEAQKTQQDYKRAATLLRRAKAGRLATLTMSALNEEGIDAVWKWLAHAHISSKDAGTFESVRNAQSVHWMSATIEKELLHRFWSDGAIKDMNKELITEVEAQKLPPTQAALRLLDLYFQQTKS
jgi:LAO/AO transport system kinase